MTVKNRVQIGAALIGLALTSFPLGNVSYAQTASPYTTAYLYNLDGQLTGTVQPCTSTGCLATRNTYSAGLLTEVDEGSLTSWPGNTNPSQWSSFGFAISRIMAYTYDSMGHVTSKEVLSGTGVPYDLTQYSYDNMERVQCAAVRMNPSQYGSLPGACALSTQGSNGQDRITYTTYDAQNHILTIDRAYGTNLQEAYATYAYTPNGLERTVEDANKNLTSLYYDGLDRLSETEFPSKTSPGTSDTGDVEQYTYDYDDNRLTLVTRDSQAIQYLYDSLNRMTEKIAPGEQSVYYGYNLQDQRLYANFSSAAGQGVSDVYDGFGEMTSETMNLSGTALTMAYQYDRDGDRTEVSYPDGVYIQYNYDGLDRLQNVLENGSTTLATYAYDNDGRLEELSRAGGLGWTTYGYDGISRLNSLALTFSSSANDVTYSITQYNPDDQVTSENVSNSAYYPLAADATTSYSANGLNQYTAVGGAAFSYDARGNLKADASNTYTYDVENHLTGSTLNSATLTYDPLGRLYEVSSTLGTTTFLYDGDRITAEYNGSGALTNRYVYGVAGDDPIVSYQGSSVAGPQYLFADHEGSIVAVTSASANVVATNQYDSYGQGGTSIQNQGRFQFTGQAYIPDLNEYYYKARMYNPSLGRFMQTDPIGYKDDVNLYSYVYNDPVDKADPSGTDALFGPTQSDVTAMADMGQLHQELWDAEYPIDQVGLWSGSFVLALAGSKLPGWAGAAARVGSLALGAAAVNQKAEHTGKTDKGEVLALLLGAVPVGKLGEAIGNVIKVSDGRETLKAAQEVGHAVAAALSAVEAIEKLPHDGTLMPVPGGTRGTDAPAPPLLGPPEQVFPPVIQLPQGDGPCSRASGCN